jgi:acyl-CoA thioester hydrolase
MGMKNKYAMLIEQKMIKASDKIASTITLEIGLMDLKLRKLIAPDSDWLKAIGVKDL